MSDQAEVSGSRLPIKVLVPRQGVEKTVPGGGSPPTPFRIVDGEFRNQLMRELSAIVVAQGRDLDSLGVIPLRVKIRKKARAKSHRPKHLFSEATCPIVGSGMLGDLILKATRRGLAELQGLLETGDSAQMIKEISTVESIEPVTAHYRLHEQASAAVLRECPRRGSGFAVKVRLFDLGDQNARDKVIEQFSSFCSREGVIADSQGYSPGSMTYSVVCTTSEQLDKFSTLVGVRSIRPMPIVNFSHEAYEAGPVSETLPVRDPADTDHPVVVVVDSGIAGGPSLQSWVIGRESLVAPQYSNPSHGTFVAGLIAWADRLNPEMSGTSQTPCAVFDLQVLPNNDPALGAVDSLTEPELLTTLDGALQRYSSDFKVWNLSLGSNTLVELDEFSTFAEELDNLQERYGVNFVIAAGNYITPPLLSFPRAQSSHASGRITTPADSVLGITVGSVSQREADHGVPSAFSRHGPGPNHVIKPDLVHYGGNCSVSGQIVDGIRSIGVSGSIETGIGTSYSTPLVARSLAQIYHALSPRPTPELARALLTHGARDPRTWGRVGQGDENVYGFGLPVNPPYCLECTPFTSTLIFEDVLTPGHYLEWDDFPYPAALSRDGKYFGEVSMTVAFRPSRGARWGSEYCETHIDAKFGVYRTKTKRDGSQSTDFVGLVPPEHKDLSVLFEEYQIEKLRKWAPVRTYHGDLGEAGEKGERWRLKVQLLERHDVSSRTVPRPQPFALIVTISDPNQRAPVYDDMVRQLRSRYQTSNLAVRTPVRAAVRTEGRTS